MPDGQEQDQARPVLDPLQVDPSVKRAAWDAFHKSSSPEEFRSYFDSAPLPKEAKRALWDAKFGGTTQAGAQSLQPTTANNEVERAKPSLLKRVGAEAAALPARAAGVGVEPDAGWNWLKSMGKMALDTANPARVGAPGFVKDIVHGMNDTSKQGEIIGKTGRSVEPAQAGEVGAFQTRPGGPIQKLGGELEHPQAAKWVRTAASMVPALGPAAVKVGHNMATGEGGDALANAGDTVSLLGQAALMTKGGQETAERAASPVVKPVAAGANWLGRAANKAIVKPVAEGFTIGTTGESMLKKGLAPYAKQTGYDPAVEKAGKDIIDYHKETPIKSVKDLYEALPEIATNIAEKEMNPVARKHADEVMAPEHFARAKTAVEAAATPFVEEFDPGAAKDVKELAEKIGKSRTVADLIGTKAGDRGGLLGYINAKMNSYFAKYPSARAMDLMTNPDTAAWEAARQSLREELLNHLEAQGETGIRDARERFGAIKELQKTTERRVNVNDRAKPMSLPRILGLVGAPLTGGLSVVAGEVANYLNKPDVLVGRGLNRMAKAAEENPRTTPAPANGRMFKAAASYKPSEKAATMSAPAKSYGPEFEAQQAQEEINRARKILDNPKATEEDKTEASARLMESKEAARKVAPTEGERAQKRTPEEENALRGEIAEVQRKIRAAQNRMGVARSFKGSRDAMDALQVHERRLGELQEAREKGTPIKLGQRGATKEELTETYRSLEGAEKEEVQSLLDIYNKSEGTGRQSLIDHYALNRGEWKGLPLTEKFARAVRGQKSGLGRMMRAAAGKPAVREPGDDDVPF